MRNIIKSMRSRYFIAVLVMGVLVTLAAAAMQYLLQQKQEDAELINRAGMQRMLAQKIALHVNQIVFYKKEQKLTQTLFTELDKSVRVFSANHQMILGEKEGKYVFLSETLMTLYFDAPANLNKRSLDFLALYDSKTFSAEVAIKMANEAQVLLFYQQQAVQLFEQGANRKVALTRLFEFVFWVSAIVVLWLEVVFIFKPMEKKVRDTIDSLELQKQKTQHALTMKTHFLARASHELRTPLQAILGFLNLYRQDGAQSQLTQVEVSAKQLVNQLNAIQEFSRWEQGDILVSVVPDDLTQTLMQAISPHEYEAQRKKIALETEFSFSTSLVIACDHEHLAWIIGQLVDNAIKFTEQGSVLIEVYLDETLTYLQIAVKDTGCGFSGVSPLSSNVAETHFQGLQLGLVRCKWLLDAMGGDIEFEKGLSSGTVVRVKTPIYLVQSQQEQHCQLRPLTGLLVEDNPLNAKIIKKVLETFSITVKHVEHGLAAVDDLSTHHYDVIFMDLNMPVMDGFQAIEYIRQTLGLSEPIIVVTANSEPVELNRAKALGADVTILKPLRKESVRTALEHVGLIQ
ncbi:response regulator [Pseudoalteromonas sp. MMG012]|uniref:response regulator n=1 Tax=Pseudoalteromonas sp. MMG012 TaxID=2822686 RepID=UPI001B3A0239|nr:response regulator [Pseudoalteromonas sp. MMG012]MBQ4850125.1 response regulator [Pseudoalteromonas sp. MMG012]